jgi:hypothetical protein
MGARSGAGACTTVPSDTGTSVIARPTARDCRVIVVSMTFTPIGGVHDA